jgi:1-deoxy-D-xylulose-5-phosphate synthase
MYSILDTINSVHDLRKLPAGELPKLAEEIRSYIIDVVSKNGGHLAPSLGTVELTISLHYIFNTPNDHLIWDVGHQSYAHKILTGRREEFKTIRTFGGLSGFPKISESEFDTYNVGHSSTSLSLALGDAVARDMKGEDRKVIAVIGDGSLTGGLSYEALNQIGHLKKDLIIILNDNEQSISKNVGAMSEYLTSLISGSFYNKMKKRYFRFMNLTPIGRAMWHFFRKIELRIKGLMVPGQLFEDLGIRYFGPVDGNNIEGLNTLLTRIKSINSGPKIVHILTKKGKGYKPAEDDPARFHGVGPFNIKTGLSLYPKKITYSDVAGRTLTMLAEKDPSIVALTAAMQDGTGLSLFAKNYPDRFFDVGIAEEHLVTFASALARNGLKPFIVIYSTFLQRAFDQMVHDTAIMNLPVTFLIDRAGIVGEDGETHHGLFDISMIRNIPYFHFLAPSNGEELRDMISYASTYGKGPLAIRYPRGAVPDQELSLCDVHPMEIFSRVTEEGADIALLAVGDMVSHAHWIAQILREHSISCRVVNLMCLKPLDIMGISRSVEKTKYFVTLENGYLSGGIGEEIVSLIPRHLKSRHIFSVGFPDIFVSHGKTSELIEAYGISAERCSERIIYLMEHNGG